MDMFDARQATLDLVTAFVNNNSLKAQELPSLLSDVYGAIAGFDATKVDVTPEISSSTEPLPETPSVSEVEPPVEKANENPHGAVSIEASLSDPNYILSMITGEKLKTLTRQLRRHGLDAQQYRARFNLPENYPMVAPAYSEFRRDIAKKMALGRGGRAKPSVVPSQAPLAAPTGSTNDAATEEAADTIAAPAITTPATAKPVIKSKGKGTTAKSPKARSSVSAARKSSTKGSATPGTEPDATSATASSSPETPLATPTGAADAAPAKKPGRPAGNGKAAAAAPAALSPATPATSDISAPRRGRAKASKAGSAVLQKAEGVDGSRPKPRRNKLKPAFSD